MGRARAHSSSRGPPRAKGSGAPRAHSLATLSRRLARQAQKEVTKSQSIALVRNLIRLNLSQLAYSRGFFPASSFSTKDGE